MNTFLTYYSQFMELGKSNPVLAGMIGLWGAGTITWLLKSVPVKIWNFCKRQTTTTLIFNNTGWGGNDLNYQGFLTWYLNSRWANFSRILALESKYEENGLKNHMGAGYGTHWFFYKGRLFWFTKKTLDSSGVTTVKEEIVVTGLTRKRQLLFDMIDDFKYKKKSGKVSAYAWTKDGWGDRVSVPERRLETVMLNEETKAFIIAKIVEFNESRQWYLDRGLPYKIVFVLHGPPGTGKTSLVRALASHFEADIHELNLSMMSDVSMRPALASVDRGSFLLIEDFDSSKALKKRPNVTKPTDEDSDTTVNTLAPASPVENIMEFSPLSLSGFLNSIDGVVPLDGPIVFMTTNDLSNIDSAVLRKGRVDHDVYIGFLSDREIKRYIAAMFNVDDVPTDRIFNNIAGCDLYSLFSEHRFDVAKFIASIPSDYRYKGSIDISGHVHAIGIGSHVHEAVRPVEEKQTA